MKCPICGIDFKPSSSTNIYCSAACRAKAERNRAKERSGKQEKYTRVCEICGTEFVTNKSVQKFCSEKCKNKAHRNYKPIMKTCKVCGGPIPANSKARLYCSEACREEGTLNRTQYPDLIAALGERGRPAQYNPRHAKTRNCVYCGKELPSWIPKSYRTCSASCSQKIKERGKEKESGRYRDNCLLCGARIVHTSTFQQYCSPECEMLYHNRERLRNGNIDNDEMNQVAKKIGRRQNMKDIAIYARRADKLGISYGKYVALYGGLEGEL